MLRLISKVGACAPSPQYSTCTCIIQMAAQGLLTDSKKALQVKATKVSWEGNGAHLLWGYRARPKGGSK